MVEDGRFGIVRADYHPGTSSVVGRHRFDDHGPTAMSELRAGRILIVENAEEDPRLDESERTATRRLGVAAYVMLPLVKEGAAVALLVAHHRSPRAWAADEVALMQETAERTWAAVERAHAEAALRRTAASLRHTQEPTIHPEDRETVDRRVREAARTGSVWRWGGGSSPRAGASGG